MIHGFDLLSTFALMQHSNFVCQAWETCITHANEKTIYQNTICHV